MQPETAMPADLLKAFEAQRHMDTLRQRERDDVLRQMQKAQPKPVMPVQSERWGA